MKGAFLREVLKKNIFWVNNNNNKNHPWATKREDGPHGSISVGTAAGGRSKAASSA